MSPALEGGFLATGPLGKSVGQSFINYISINLLKELVLPEQVASFLSLSSLCCVLYLFTSLHSPAQLGAPLKVPPLPVIHLCTSSVPSKVASTN